MKRTSSRQIEGCQEAERRILGNRSSFFLRKMVSKRVYTLNINIIIIIIVDPMSGCMVSVFHIYLI